MLLKHAKKKKKKRTFGPPNVPRKPSTSWTRDAMLAQTRLQQHHRLRDHNCHDKKRQKSKKPELQFIHKIKCTRDGWRFHCGNLWNDDYFNNNELTMAETYRIENCSCDGRIVSNQNWNGIRLIKRIQLAW